MITVIQCIDRVGLVASISGVLAAEQLNIVSLREHVDPAANRFFMRIETAQEAPAHVLESKLLAVLPEGAVVTVNPLPEKRVVVLVTKEYHCLSDILIRHHFKTLGAQVQCVIGNHSTLKPLCERFDLPFYLVSHEDHSRESFEESIGRIIHQFMPDYIVLAKFMRILSPAFVAQFGGRIINIHHSFLPAFIGANPYKQAFERGVKMIGATAHFVTNELDEGPIIAQQIIPVDHSHTAAGMMRAGKEIETAVLAKALRLVFDDRVLLYKNKTVVFE